MRRPECITKESGMNEEITEPESISVVVQEAEAPYISIACDLIKETKISNETNSRFL